MLAIANSSLNAEAGVRSRRELHAPRSAGIDSESDVFSHRLCEGGTQGKWAEVLSKEQLGDGMIVDVLQRGDVLAVALRARGETTALRRAAAPHR